MTEFLHGGLTREIIGAAFEVWKTLGYGYLEKVYENALAVELKLRGIAAQQRYGIDVFTRKLWSANTPQTCSPRTR